MLKKLMKFFVSGFLAFTTLLVNADDKKKEECWYTTTASQKSSGYSFYPREGVVGIALFPRSCDRGVTQLFDTGDQKKAEELAKNHCVCKDTGPIEKSLIEMNTKCQDGGGYGSLSGNRYPGRIYEIK